MSTQLTQDGSRARERSRRGVAMGGSLALLLAVLLIGWHMRSRSGEESIRSAAAAAPQRPSGPSRRAARPAAKGGAVKEGKGRRGHGEGAAPPPQTEGRMDALSEYLLSSVYPPNSRPLTHNHQDLIAPNSRHERLRNSPADPSVRYRFSADAYWVTGRQPLSVWLEAQRDDQPLMAQIEAARMTILSEDGTASAQSMQLALEPAEGRQQATVQLADVVDSSEPVRLRFEARFNVAGAVEQASFNVIYNPEQSVPARFTGHFEPQVQDGSLCIDVGVEVLAEGRYLIDGNLWAGDEPVGWTRFKGELKQDAKSARLCFFGKVLADKGLAGPYRLAQLRGALHRPGREPDMQQMQWYDGSFETQAYPLSTWSDAEWDSPHKQRKISMLKSLQDSGTGPQIHRPLP